MSDPVLNFVSIVGNQVAASFADFPEGARVVLVNETSGETEPSPVSEASGSGPLEITLPTGFASGAYYLKGVDKDGGYLAQSVQFYVA